MPELPEVNTVMKLFRSQVLQQPIVKVEVKDEYILKNRNGDEFIQSLQGHQFVDTYRQGKYFFGILDNDQSVLFHLGMTGDIIYYQDPIEEPRHIRFLFQLNTNLYVGYQDPRKFSTILILEDHKDYLEHIQLGIDALSCSEQEFVALFKNRKGILKGALLNQKIIAGLGNLYIDEICYQAHIHPASKIENLSVKQLKSIYNHMQQILHYAVENNAYYKIYPEDWFWKWRKENEVLPSGHMIQKKTIAGRTTYWAKDLQKKY